MPEDMEDMLMGMPRLVSSKTNDMNVDNNQYWLLTKPKLDSSPVPMRIDTRQLALAHLTADSDNVVGKC
jgi:hypothetical protein